MAPLIFLLKGTLKMIKITTKKTVTVNGIKRRIVSKTVLIQAD
jgi:hypothetical protein